MVRPKQWLWGLLPLLALIALAISLTEREIMADLVGRVRAELSRQGIDWARVDALGRDIRVTGQAASPDDRSRASRTIAGVAGTRRVDDRSSIIAIRSPYDWNAEKADGTLTLMGAVPSEAIRRQLTAEAKAAMPAVPIVDQLELARGAPDGFAEAAALVLRQLGRMGDGRGRISDLRISLQGTAGTTETIAAVEQAMAGAPAGFGTARVVLAPPRATPYLFEATRDDAGLTLAGHVPNDAVRAAILAMARQSLAGVAVTDRMSLADGAPAGYEAMTGFALAQLGQLSSGRASLRDGALTLRGIAPDGLTYAAVTRAVRSGLPAVLTSATAAITAPVIAPYRFSAIRQGETIAIGGFVPDEAARADVLAAVRAVAPTLTIADRTQIGLGAPQGFQVMARFVAGQAARLDPASALLVDSTLTIQGRAGTFAVLDAVSSTLRQPPSGMTVARIDLVPPTVRPFTWSARLHGHDVLLEGHAPSHGAREQILARARAVVANAAVVDRMRIAEGAPAAFLPAALFGLGQLQRLSEGVVSLSGPDFAISGTGRDTTGASDIAAAAAGPQGLPRGATIVQNDVLATVAAARPYTFTVTRTAQGVTLDGFAPSEADRAALVEAARSALPGIGVSDRIKVADGAPADMDWMAAGRFALMQIARLRQGTAGYVDQAFSIEGEAADRPGYVAANRAVRAEPLPNGGRLVRAEIRPPVVSPYHWFVQKDGNGVLLQGFVPSEAVREANRAEALRIFAPLAVRDSQELAAGAPEGFAETAVFAMTELARLAKGRAAVLDRTLKLTGEAPTEAAAGEIRNGLPASGPGGFTLSHAVTGPVQPATGRGPVADSPCLRRIREIQATGTIDFRPDSDLIRPDGLNRLARIADAMRQCPAVGFTVEAHTDDTGQAARNLDLSQARALSVTKYLVRRGVPASRLTAQGFGQTRPIVANDTPANRAKNRRIDFVVRP